MQKGNEPKNPSRFIQKHIPAFLERFDIDFTIDGHQIQYFVNETETKKEISCSIEVSLDKKNKRIDMLMFYPGLDRLSGTRYFSSTCFFLVMHHFMQHFHLKNDYSIFLRSELDTFDRFYAQFLDFDFLVYGMDKDHLVNASCRFQPMDVDVSMIIERFVESNG